jgi:hypothetical protein
VDDQSLHPSSTSPHVWGILSGKLSYSKGAYSKRCPQAEEAQHLDHDLTLKDMNEMKSPSRFSSNDEVIHRSNVLNSIALFK